MVYIIKSYELYKAEYKYIGDICQQDRPKSVTSKLLMSIGVEILKLICEYNLNVYIVHFTNLNTSQISQYFIKEIRRICKD